LSFAWRESADEGSPGLVFKVTWLSQYPRRHVAPLDAPPAKRHRVTPREWFRWKPAPQLLSLLCALGGWPPRSEG